MFKKFTAVFVAMIIVFCSMVSTVFAYSNMYTQTSGIPDYSEVTGCTLMSKEYQSNSTLYIYYNDGYSGMYPYYLNQNGYVWVDNSYDYNRNIYNQIYINPYKGLAVILSEAEYVSGVTIAAL